MNSTLYTNKMLSQSNTHAADVTRTALIARRLIRGWGRWWQAWCSWNDRQRQRRHLGALDDHLLDDIGVNRKAAKQEASRWFFC